MAAAPHRIGILHQMWAQRGTPDGRLIEETVDDVTLAESLGFDSMWFGEHHFRADKAFYGRIPVPELLIASLAARTERIKLGTGVKVLALDQTFRVAEAMSLLDLLTEGRATFGVGQGTNPSVFPAGLDKDERRANFRHELAQLLEELRGSERSTVDVSPLPVEDLQRRIWVAARDDVSIAHAAELGLHFVVGQIEASIVQKAFVDTYRAAGGRGEARGVRTVFAGETPEAARQGAKDAAELYFSSVSKAPYYRQAVEAGVFDGPEPADLDDLFHRLCYVVGDPDEVAAGLVDHVETVGLDRLDVMFHVPGLDRGALHRSMELFATEVVPRLPEALVRMPTPATA